MKPEFQPCLTGGSYQSEEGEGDAGRDVMWGAEGKKTSCRFGNDFNF